MNQMYIPEYVKSKNGKEVVIHGHMRQTSSISIMYHLTDTLPFFPKANFRNMQQEFGAGFYVTNKEHVRKWNHALGGRDYVIELALDDVKMIREEDFPSKMKMAKFLKSKSFESRDLDLFKPSGDSFNRNPVDIATKRAWMYYKGINAVVPFRDKKEGEQMILTDLNTVKIFRQIPIMKFINMD